MIRHHPSPVVSLSYAAGTLPTPHAQVVSLHFAACPDCRRDARLLEEAAGVLLDTADTTPVSADALEHVLARLQDGAPTSPAPIAWPSATAALATGRWRWRGPGITMMPLIDRDATGTRLDLIRVAPGSALLQHGHTSLETTLVLQGSFEDGTETYAAGDFAEADGALNHQPRALAGADCICLVATSGQLSASGLLGRLIRLLLGM